MTTRTAVNATTRTVISINNYSIHILSAKLAKKPELIHTQKGMNAVKAGINVTKLIFQPQIYKKIMDEECLAGIKNRKKSHLSTYVNSMATFPTIIFGYFINSELTPFF